MEATIPLAAVDETIVNPYQNTYDNILYLTQIVCHSGAMNDGSGQALITPAKPGPTLPGVFASPDEHPPHPILELIALHNPNPNTPRTNKKS
ncbi:MAG: hypothetical protein AAGF45_03750, partial [Pseudomonadota bacterium]